MTTDEGGCTILEESLQEHLEHGRHPPHEPDDHDRSLGVRSRGIGRPQVSSRSLPAPDAAEPVEETATHVPERGEEATRVDRLLDQVVPPERVPSGGGGLRTARILSVSGATGATIAWRGSNAATAADVAGGVDVEILAEAAEDQGTVLVEEGPRPLVVGVLQTRRPRELKLHAGSVHIEGEREVLIRAGSAAIRLREDGDIEIVAGRIHAASRGLFRIVGRLLRLN